MLPTHIPGESRRSMSNATDLLRRIGLNLRSLRRQRGLTQEEVAERAGFTAKYISEIERGHRNPPIDTLARIAVDGVGCSLAQLVAPASPTSKQPAPLVLPPRVRDVAERIAELPSPQVRARVLKLVNEIVTLAQHAPR